MESQAYFKPSIKSSSVGIDLILHLHPGGFFKFLLKSSEAIMGTKPSENSPFADATKNRYMALRIGILLAIFAFIAGGYASYVALGYNWVWYSYHPISMISSFVALAGNAVLMKKIGGYENTKKHGYLMVAATLLAIFGWYVIYSNKNIQKKKHLTSIHGKIGMFVILGNLSLAMMGAVALNPDWGFLKTNKRFRLVHKLSGRAITAAAWLSCALGFMTIEKDFYYRAAFFVPLIGMAYFVLL